MKASRVCLVCLPALVACSDGIFESADGGAAPTDLGEAPVPSIKGPALSVRVRSSDDLQLLPSRIIIAPVSPTPPPDFHRDGATARIISADALAITDGVLLVTGQAVVPMPPGTYDLTILQGLEYEQAIRRVTIGPQDVITLDEVLEHSVRTPGWLAADMHIHTSRSFDSKLLPAHRVISEVAAGIELLVPTDHVWHHQLQSYVEALGYGERAVSIPGSEYGFKYGHLGVYPVEFDPQGAQWGGPAWELYENWGNLTDTLVFSMIHGLPGQPVVVVNHPRMLPDLGYFTNIGWPHIPSEPLSTAGQFDGMEVLNGYQSAPSDLTPLFRDWFYFLSGGYRVTGLGNSDSHRMDWLTSGYPRTWLRLPTDEPTRVLPSDLREAILGMRAVASSGPWLKLHVDGHDIGDTFVPTGPSVTVDVEADAVSWIDLSRVLIYHNGVMVHEFFLPSPRSHPALRQQLTLPVASDGWIVAIAVGEKPLPTAVIGAVGGGQSRPVALTNPVWIDSNGDGKIVPPPLPPGMPPQPFGKVGFAGSQGEAARVGAPFLHAPLDCAPDEYLEWLERSGATK